MFHRRIALAAIALLVGAAPALAFQISSSSVSNGKWDKKFIANAAAGCDGGNISPALTWKDPPAGTKSFAITLYDPDAPTGSGWWHWQVWNIPATVTSFAEGQVPAGVAQSKGDVGQAAYLGPCPPTGSAAHRYIFTVYALKVEKLDIDPNASAALVGFNLNGNAVGKASVTYTYKR
jgi:Raf kinase inhibitor-like YbhB/YbcL family protein